MKFRRIEWAITMKNLYWIFKCFLAVIASIAVVIFIVVENAKSHKETQSTKQAVYDNATVKSVSDNATVKSVYGKATVRIFNKGVKVNRVSQEAVLICIDCKPQIKKTSKTAHIIKSKKVLHDIDSFQDVFDLQTKKGKIHLYKSVQPDNTDFYSGKIKYEGNVICPDWDEDPNRQCGGGLHLSPTPELALLYHQGKILECEVDIKDLIVYPHDISKVRCKKVKVLGEPK